MRDNLRAVRLRVGRNIRSLRSLRGLSQERLAELVGNTQKHMGQVERGEVNVTIDILTAIAASLSVNVWELLGPAPESAPGVRVYAITERDLDQIEQALRIVNRAKRASPRRGRGSD